MNQQILSTNRIHQNLINPYKIVLYTAGVGAHAMAEFTLHPGSSSYALEASSFYAQSSLELLLEHKIEHFVTEQVAEEMAFKGLLRSHQILRHQEQDQSSFLFTLGVGITGAIRSIEPRKGRHHAYICLHFGCRKYIYHIELDKGVRSREEEDILISQIAIDLIIQHCGEAQGCFHKQFTKESKEQQQHFLIPQQCQITLVNQQLNICLFDLLIDKPQYLNSILLNNISYQLNPLIEKAVILSGSFNPIHQGHIELINQASINFGCADKFYELSLLNADKGKIGEEEIWKRINIMREKDLQIIVSNRPLFKDKNVFLRNGAFVIGADTYKRLIDTKYYNNSVPERDISFIKFLQFNNKIIVAPRYNEITQKMEGLIDFEIPPLIAKHVIEIKGFRNDISSSQIRKKENIRAQSTPH